MTQTRVEMFCGNCLEVMPTFLSGSVAMVFADLPYGLKSTSMVWDKLIPMQALWNSLRQVSQKNAAYIFTAVQPFTSHLVLSNARSHLYNYVWRKNFASNFFNAHTQPLRNHEDIVVFADAQPRYNPQKTTGHKIYAITRHETKSAHFNKAQRKTRYSASADGTRYPLSVQDFAKDPIRHGIHPTQKPVALLEWLIKTYTNPGDIVLDPVSGSATTAIAALRTGRNVICIEKDRAYFEAGVKRAHEEVAASGVNAEVIVHG